MADIYPLNTIHNVLIKKHFFPNVIANIVTEYSHGGCNLYIIFIDFCIVINADIIYWLNNNRDVKNCLKEGDILEVIYKGGTSRLILMVDYYRGRIRLNNVPVLVNTEKHDSEISNRYEVKATILSPPENFYTFTKYPLGYFNNRNIINTQLKKNKGYINNSIVAWNDYNTYPTVAETTSQHTIILDANIGIKINKKDHSFTFTIKKTTYRVDVEGGFVNPLPKKFIFKRCTISYADGVHIFAKEMI
jgi:hypothetical protein